MAIEKPHPEPRFYAFWLIVWWLVDEERLSFDCLHPEYEMAAGTKVHSDGMVAWRGAARKLGKG